ncbi:MAG: DUF4870 domain-containing protein [Jaaginema sp. PMC 1079.18]|nr:DUF4870 domain-containing protein [Jaaginema sp. PMC 1080.18]MEC4853676.1 DUF4870 domain-containing protein [Jaaginema sp. PMC 1079.18]MEC4867842.1 DUF4870 domain-containing protein [Jaaginema sp. PMC 1078.18]
MNNSGQRKTLSIVCHAAIFISAALLSVAVPIVLMLVSDDAVVKANAKESLNFHLNVFILGIIFGALVFVGIGIPLLGLLGLLTIVMPIIAIVKILEDPEKPYRYPFIFRVV